ncbi:MAG TPA: hypothetical protein VI233_03475 [Puia sp.]
MMNSDVMHSRVQMEPAILKNLVAEVKETVATEVVLAKSKTNNFGALKLWSLRRNSRYAARAVRQPSIITGFGY